MPKYRYARPFDIIREIKQTKQGLKDLIIQLQQNGFTLSSGITGTNLGPGVSNSADQVGANIMRLAPEFAEATPIPESIVADPYLTDNQKEALQSLYDAYLRSNQQTG